MAIDCHDHGLLTSAANALLLCTTEGYIGMAIVGAAVTVGTIVLTSLLKKK